MGNVQTYWYVLKVRDNCSMQKKNVRNETYIYSVKNPIKMFYTHTKKFIQYITENNDDNAHTK